jgi:tetratricopeptide (TPR) repeat protein
LSTTLTLRATTSSTRKTASTVLDLTSVLKASQAISGEIVFDQLLKKLMTVIIENAGAQRGFIILEKNGQWVIEAEGAIDKDEVTVLQSIPLSQLSVIRDQLSVPTTLINYVAHAVVLHHAAQEGQFTHDPHIVAYKTQSALCAPLINQGKLTGLLYLENNLTSGAFTQDRLKVLNLLSSQIAISIENARLYTNMAALNQAYERFVPSEFQMRQRAGYRPIQIGIGVNTGALMLGTVGGKNRMDGTVISDVVNLASRIEDRVKVKGKSKPVIVYEVFDGNAPHIIDLKMKTLRDFEQGLAHYRQREFAQAKLCFKQVLRVYADDMAALIYFKRCEHFQKYGVSDDWEWVEVLETK